MPKIASWICCPGCASLVSTTRFGRVESLDELAAGLAQHQRQLAVHPDLGVVVDDQLENHGGRRRTSKSPTFSGRVTLVRYQLKARRPCDRRCSRARAGSTPSAESSKSAACGVRGDVVGPVGRRPTARRSGPGSRCSTSTILTSL